MGGSVSAGAGNDEMIDNLIKSRHIRSNIVEMVFRSVDRAFYYLDEFQHIAYRQHAWRKGNLHLSSPGIYALVLERLKLETGHSFLNIGSGTGYLSTLAGLLLGPYGTNHGIETHADVVEYAYEKLQQFKKTCCGIDVFEFCEPVFVVGNVFNLTQDRRYDRIYCGAACPEFHLEHIKKFMKVGGVLVLPSEGKLLTIVRTSEESWEISSIGGVRFSTIQFPDDHNASPTISMPNKTEPLRLKEICRSVVRSLLRSSAAIQELEWIQKRKCKHRSGSRTSSTTGIERLIRNYQNLNDNAYEAIANFHPGSGNGPHNQPIDGQVEAERNSNDNESSVSESDDSMEINNVQDSDFTEDLSYEESGSDVEQTNASNLSSSSLSVKCRMYMEKKIQALSLPKTVKLYLNYDRVFLSSPV